MRKSLLILLLIGLALSATFLFAGCKNPDSSKPTVPGGDGPGGTGDNPDPNVTTPFSVPMGMINDIGIEGDGDIVFATTDGALLFTAYGFLKRTLSGDAFAGIATANQGVAQTGRGIVVLGAPAGCSPSPLYDDQYVTSQGGGVMAPSGPYTGYNGTWWGGEADPNFPQICKGLASSSQYTSCMKVPAPIAYHPLTGFAWQYVNAPNCIADSDCEWPNGNIVPLDPGEAYAIMAYNPQAPGMDRIWVGMDDYLNYYDYPVWKALTDDATNPASPPAHYTAPACAQSALFLVWDPLNPPPLGDFMLTAKRQGMKLSNVADFEFDQLGRLIIAVPGGDSVIITEPVVFGNLIVVQKVLGGRQNGLGTLPGEFQNPTAVAIDPRNQNILISDTGNRRVQVFDNDGNFIREFGVVWSNFSPGAIRVDAFGAIYVANTNPEGAPLLIFNENGSPVIYGSLEGWVYDKTNHQPLGNVGVHVNSTFMPQNAVTDKNGHFLFSAVPAGTVDVVAEKYAYNGGQVRVDIAGGNKTMVDIFLERQQTQPADFGQVTGTVMSSLYDKSQAGVTAEIIGQPVTAITNTLGEFILYNVPAGSHTLRLSSGGINYYEKYITVTKGGVLDIGIVWLPIP
jgi:hypothetical protein